MQTILSAGSTRGLIARAAAAAFLSLAVVGATASLAEARKMSTTYTTSLGPATATNPVGANHTLKATVIRHTENCDPNGQVQIEPAIGVNVKFEVLSGPNQGKSGVGTTNAQGQATFTYTSSLAGKDILVATPLALQNKGVCNIDTGPAQPSTKVEAIWVASKGGGPGEGGPGPSDGIPQIKINDVRVTEGNTDLSPATPATFTVSLSMASSVPITVEYATADGSAIAPADYVAEHEKLTFKPGDPLTQKVTIDVRGDHLDEADEWFKVDLSNPTNAGLADPQGIGTIIDDDGPGVPTG
jgi:hypothetical protein